MQHLSAADARLGGLWLEGSDKFFSLIQRNFRTSIEKGMLCVGCSYINRDNINRLFAEHGMSGEIDLLSVDIDGNDWHVLRAILEGRQIEPRVICTEYNALIPPADDPDDTSSDWIMEYVEDWYSRLDDCHGASLSAFYHLCREFGYHLVGTSYNGVNAFFVRHDAAEGKFATDANGARPFFNPILHGRSFGKPGHPGGIALNEDMRYRMEFYNSIKNMPGNPFV